MSEAELQKAIASYLDDIQRLYKAFVWFHPPNGGQRSKRYAKFLQGQGVKAGVPDIVILTDDKPILIEIKYKTSLSETQKAFHEKVKFLEIPVYTVKAKTDREAVNQVELILLKHGIFSNEQSEKETVPCRQ